MITVIKNKFSSFFAKGHERTIKVKRNIALSLLIKSLAILVGFGLVPLTINYVNATQYGIWLTLSSIISWFSFFDVGLGNGLKNKLVALKSNGDVSNLRVYVSTTYAILILIATFFFIVFFIANRYINWYAILNVQKNIAINFKLLVLVVFGIFCIQFVLQLLNVVLTACHEPAKVSYITIIGQVISLIAIYLLTTMSNEGTILKLVLVLAGFPLIVQFISSVWFYSKKYKDYSPGLAFVKFKFAKNMLSVGGVFFVIQIGALILFQTDNIVITQIFGPLQVTTFNVAFKLFSIITMVLNIIMTPFWSAFTEAYTKGDMAWIKNILTKMRWIWCLICLVTVLLFFAAPTIYKLWLHGTVQIPLSLSLAMAIYVIAYSWQTIHVFFLNGIGKIKLQLYLVIISSLLNIPIAIFLGKRIGLAGITLSNAILFIIMSVVFYFQTNKILSGTAKGIFNS